MSHISDIIIVGGGLIGHSLACALTYFNPRLKIVLLEANAQPATNKPNFTSDRRMLSLAHSSYLILNHLQLWSELAKVATPMLEVHVSEVGRFGSTRFLASEQGLPALGYAVPAAILIHTLMNKTQTLTNVTQLAPATVVDYRFEKNLCSLDVKTPKETLTLTSHLVIAADGSHSTLRTLQQIATTEFDYEEDAIIATIELARHHKNKAFERFTPLGPLAMLPNGEKQCTMIWSSPRAKSQFMLAWDDATFLQQLKESFGYRMGALKQIGPRISYPLKRIEAQEQIKNGVVLLGNAAHTMHPIAAQGFNLGLRDAAVLAELIAPCVHSYDQVLDQYQAWRKQDQRSITNLTHQLSRIFNSQFLPTIQGRNFAMLCLDLIPSVNRFFVNRTLGLAGRRPSLACELE